MALKLYLSPQAKKWPNPNKGNYSIYLWGLGKPETLSSIKGIEAVVLRVFQDPGNGQALKEALRSSSP